MPSSLIDADSLLTVDVGTCLTRATLFDVVEGSYRFIAAGQAATTAAAPLRDVREGVNQAILQLQSVIGRTFLNADHQLIMPTQEGMGIDTFAVTVSAGPVISTVVVGLLNDVSLASLQRLARSTYTRIVETIGINDNRKAEQQIDSILHLRPDLILIAGGTDGGATRSLRRLIEITSLACHLLPMEKRPAVMYAGNPSIAPLVKSSMQSLVSSMHISPNIRPSLEDEDLQHAQHALAEMYGEIRGNQIGGIDELKQWSGGNLLPTAYAHGRIIRFLSQIYDSRKGILGVDLGASAATISAAFGGELTLGVYPQLGLGEGLAQLLRYTSLEDIIRWLPLDIPAELVRDYIYQKSIYPTSVPAGVDDLAIEQALARQALYLAMLAAGKDFSRNARVPVPGLSPYFEPILAGGSAITHAPTFGQSLLILLDAIQPVGVTTLILDQNNLLPALGVAASRNPILPVHVLESGAFLGLATVVSPIVSARSGTTILRLRLLQKNGNETRLDVKQGSLEVLPLASGQTGRLYLQPLHHTDIGFGTGRGGEISVSGTVLGIVIDARGRPLRLPVDHGRRREFIKKWLWALGG